MCSGGRHISISDQSMVQFACGKLSINGISRGHNVITYRNFRKFNRENFRNDVAQIFCSTNPNDVWYNGKGFFSLSLTNMPSLRTMLARARSSPWITSELKKRMHDRDILKLISCKCNDPNWLDAI